MSPDATEAALAMENQKLPDWKLSYRPDEAAAATGLGISTIFLKLAEGKLKAKKDGTATLIKRQELQRYIDDLPDWTPPKGKRKK